MFPHPPAGLSLSPPRGWERIGDCVGKKEAFLIETIRIISCQSFQRVGSGFDKPPCQTWVMPTRRPVRVKVCLRHGPAFPGGRAPHCLCQSFPTFVGICPRSALSDRLPQHPACGHHRWVTVTFIFASPTAFPQSLPPPPPLSCSLRHLLLLPKAMFNRRNAISPAVFLEFQVRSDCR